MRTTQRAAGNAARNDLVRTRSIWWIWCIPAVLIVLVNVAWGAHWLSFAETGALLTALTAWIGVACYVNGRRCGRFHCTIIGYGFPLLSVLGLLNTVGVTSVSWRAYMGVFLLVVVVGFAPECCGVRYVHRDARGPSGTDGTR